MVKSWGLVFRQLMPRLAATSVLVSAGRPLPTDRCCAGFTPLFPSAYVDRPGLNCMVRTV